MKKLLIIITLLFLTVNANAAVNEMGWTTAIGNNWTTMVNGNHAIYQQLVAESDVCVTNCGGSNYYGIRDAVLYQATSDAKYANRVLNTVAQSAGTWADRNKVRDSFVQIAVAYSLAANGMTAGNKSGMETILDDYVTKVFSSSYGTRPWDTDEMVGNYFGLIVYALAIRADDLSRSNELLNKSGLSYCSEVGGLTATAANWETWRNAVYGYFSKLGQGGEWMESSMYNMNSIRYVMLGVHAINDFCSGDAYCTGTEFAEITALYDDFAETYYQKAVPNYSQHYDFSDSQNGYRRTFNSFRGVSLYAMLGFLDSDANCWDIADDLESGDPGDGTYYLFWDSTAARTKDSGQTDWNSSGMGIGYWHEGWTDGNETFYASQVAPFTNVDHDMDGVFNFNIWKNGTWIINNPKWYYGHPYEDSPYYNHVLLYGAYTGMKEARGQIAWEGESEYMYHSGVTSGYWHKSGYDAPAPPFIAENTRQLLLVHTDADKELVFIHDRIDACKPSSDSCITNGWYADRLPQRYRDRATGASAKHHWVIHVNETATNNGGGNFQWTTSDANEIYLQTYIPSYTAINVDMSAGGCSSPYYFCGEGDLPGSAEAQDQLRLAVTADGGYQFHEFLNVLYTDGSASLTEITEEAGSTEDTHGAMVDTGSQWIVALFNADEDTTTTFTSTVDSGNDAVYDSSRFDKAKKMSLFQSDSEVKFTTNNSDDIDVYILGLDTTKSWTVTANGGDPGETVSGSGVYNFTISGAAQEHTVDWTSSPYACDESDWRGCVVGDCVSTGWYWYDAACHENPEPTDYCASEWTQCFTIETCQAAGWCWDDGFCLEVCIEDPVESENVTIYASEDVYLRGGSYAALSQDGDGKVVVKATNDDVDFNRVGLLKFPISANVPEGSSINNITLRMTASNNGNVAGEVYYYKCLRDWVEGEATWNEWKSGSSWTTAGAKGNATDIEGNWTDGTSAFGYYAIGGGEAIGDLLSFEIRGDIKEYVTPDLVELNIAIHQIQIVNGANFFMYDRDNATGSYRPNLVINYTPPIEDQGYIPPDDPAQLHDRVWCGVFCGVLSN